jgi:transposase-like protein
LYRLRNSVVHMPNRVRVTATPCPECGTNLHVVENGIMAAEVRRYCPRGCALTTPGVTLLLARVSR